VGFFERAAAKTELRTQALLGEALTQYGGGVNHGQVIMPCHILSSEVHHGIWASRGGDGIGVYRCQGHFWSISLPEGSITAALVQPDQTQWLRIRSLQGNHSVEDLGLISHGVQPLAGFFAGLTWEKQSAADLEHLDTIARKLRNLDPDGRASTFLNFDTGP
jgi:hypothetical protein